MFAPTPDRPLSCPVCHATTKQLRDGKNATGTLRYECRHCRRTYTPHPKPHGCDLNLHRQALNPYSCPLFEYCPLLGIEAFQFRFSSLRRAGLLVLELLDWAPYSRDFLLSLRTMVR